MFHCYSITYYPVFYLHSNKKHFWKPNIKQSYKYVLLLYRSVRIIYKNTVKLEQNYIKNKLFIIGTTFFC